MFFNVIIGWLNSIKKQLAVYFKKTYLIIYPGTWYLVLGTWYLLLDTWSPA